MVGDLAAKRFDLPMALVDSMRIPKVERTLFLLQLVELLEQLKEGRLPFSGSV
jgi:hypothetical protein